MSRDATIEKGRRDQIGVKDSGIEYDAKATRIYAAALNRKLVNNVQFGED